MKKNINITVNSSNGEIIKNTGILGINGENLQGNIIFSFKGDFVSGVAWLEVEMPNGTKGHMEMTNVENTYVLPILSSLLKDTGIINMNLRITETPNYEEIPVFKSKIFPMEVLESINSTTTIPDEYPTWLDTANAKILEMDQALAEVDRLDIDIDNNVVTITKKDGTTKSENVKGDKGEDAKINGVNTVNIVAGDNITIDQEDDTLTINSTGGGSGTSNYNNLSNKPKINNVELVGNKTSSDLGLVDLNAINNKTLHLVEPQNIISNNLGEPITLNTNNWIKGNDWTQSGDTFAHTSGAGHSYLEYPINAERNTFYYITFHVDSPSPSGAPNASTAFTLVIGESPRFIAYNGGGSRNYAFGIKTKDTDAVDFNGNLQFIPTDEMDYMEAGNSFDGTISNIRVYKIASGNINTPTYLGKNVNGTTATEERILHDSLYIGLNSGKETLTGGELNVAIGNGSMVNNTTGYWNTAVGYNTLRDNTLGSRNVAIGKMALQENISGDRNVAIGSFALCRNTDGRNNIAIGADSLWVETSGQGNIGLGLASLGELTTGNYNIGIGYSAGTNINGEHNIALGWHALGESATQTGDSNIALGRWALRKNQGNGNIAVGATSMLSNTTGYSNTVVGSASLANNVSGNRNVAIGASTANKSTGNQNVFIGCGTATNVVAGQKNTIIGAEAGTSVVTGSLNTALGYGSNIGSAVQNGTAIGYGANATNSNQVVIGNEDVSETILHGNIKDSRIFDELHTVTSAEATSHSFEVTFKSNWLPASTIRSVKVGTKTYAIVSSGLEVADTSCSVSLSNNTYTITFNANDTRFIENVVVTVKIYAYDIQVSVCSSFTDYAELVNLLYDLPQNIYGKGQTIYIYNYYPHLWISNNETNKAIIPNDILTDGSVDNTKFITYLATNGSIKIGYYELKPTVPIYNGGVV